MPKPKKKSPPASGVSCAICATAWSTAQGDAARCVE